MRILSVRQPWALHIIQSGKDVENRSRNVAGAYRGPVAIHASLKMDDIAMARLPMHAPNGIPRSFRTGVILGVVDLVDVHSVDDCIEQQPNGDWLVCSEWAERQGHHLVLANPRPLKKPMPYKGMLGLRELPDDVAKGIEEAI